MKQITQQPRLPRTKPTMLASHRSLIIEARESRLLGWRREAAYYLHSAAVERQCIAMKESRK
ncbi:hypothetical protein ENKO_17080 [Enterobacter kobei]|uniref:Uncharacterized protein n=2 Tax=Enterobacter kobei TaxID=208224 RepID=A0AA86IPA4_9ENTR|nr:hypothetical protein BH713_12975 [Enterobacter kobei]BCU55114.1 hypothetical protein ENKO_17080 [Enterobacter kobei]SIQ96301.1 hypothetical protein SAMN05444841_102604 [Enterobacter kobei]